jgi:excisionase family DNA binding protein
MNHNLILTQLTIPEVRELFRNELESFFPSRDEATQQPEADQLFNIKQAAAFISLSVPTVYGLVCRSEIPCMKKGKRLYFSKDELTSWIKSGRKKTLAEIQSETNDYLSNKKGGKL